MEEIGLEITVHVAIGGDIGAGAVVAAGFDPGDPWSLADALQVGGDVAPVFATILRDLDVAIVGADPDGFVTLRRFADGIDGVIHFGG